MCDYKFWRKIISIHIRCRSNTLFQDKFCSNINPHEVHKFLWNALHQGYTKGSSTDLFEPEGWAASVEQFLKVIYNVFLRISYHSKTIEKKHKISRFVLRRKCTKRKSLLVFVKNIFSKGKDMPFSSTTFIQPKHNLDPAGPREKYNQQSKVK